MIRGVIIGQYYPVRSTVHSMDPRAKILIATIFMVILFMGNNFYCFLAMGLFAVIAVLLSKVPWHVVVRTVRPMLFILIFTLALHLFLTPGPVLVRVGPITATWSGLVQGLFIGTRLVILIMFTSLLTLTTSPVELTDGLEDVLRPFSRLGVPHHELAMMMTIALRFIPTLLEEAERIMKAQMARGADFQSGNMLRRARNLAPLLVPLFVSAFRRADELALAMEARCYRGGEGRTRMKKLEMHRADYVGILLVLLASIVVVYLRIKFGPVIQGTV